MATRELHDKEYRKLFSKYLGSSDKGVTAKALERALDIRKFEIDLYWKRASYFWTFIAATFAGFVAIQASGSASKTDLSVLLCNLGIVFSFGWLCVNRGSKFWQENWENHVDMLEDSIQGPLHKVVVSRAKPTKLLDKVDLAITGPSPISVSKINQLISLFITTIWCTLLWHSLPPFTLDAKINWHYATITSLSVLSCLGFITLGRTYSGDHLHKATIRDSRINS